VHGRRLAGAALVVLVWFGCQQRDSSPRGAALASAPDAALGAADAAPPSSASLAVAPGSAAAGTPSVRDALERAPLRSIRREADGSLTAELDAKVDFTVRVELATRDRPRAHRAPVAYERIAARVAPGLVPDAELRAIPLGELAKAALDTRTARHLEQVARVLSDGKVRACLSLIPRPGAVAVDLGDLSEGSRAFGWESALVRREPPKEAERALLASYQALLVVDYLAGNLARKRVELAGERLLASMGNEVFSQRGVEAGVGDPLSRLLRHTAFSRRLQQRLSALERDSLERALRGPLDEGLLVTPKELEEIVDRRRGIEKLVDGLVTRRGRDKALILP
jgi:hypothetical protein